MKGKRRESS